MINVGTKLNVIDNSGLKQVKCLKILGINKRKYGYVGDKILVSVVKGNIKKLRDKNKIYLGIIARVSKPIIRLGGEVISCQDNAVVLVKRDGLPLGTRILGPIMLELRENRYMKIVSLALICV